MTKTTKQSNTQTITLTFTLDQEKKHSHLYRENLEEGRQPVLKSIYVAKGTFSTTPRELILVISPA